MLVQPFIIFRLIAQGFMLWRRRLTDMKRLHILIGAEVHQIPKRLTGVIAYRNSDWSIYQSIDLSWIQGDRFNNLHALIPYVGHIWAYCNVMWIATRSPFLSVAHTSHVHKLVKLLNAAWLWVSSWWSRVRFAPTVQRMWIYARSRQPCLSASAPVSNNS